MITSIATSPSQHEIDFPIYAHRALDNIDGVTNPNSFEMSNFTEAGIECDVFLLSDGNFAVLHNNDIGPLAQEDVEAMSLEQLTGYCSDKENGYPNPPTIREFMSLAVDRGNKLRIELKASSPEKAAEAGEKLADKLFNAEAGLVADVVNRGYSEEEAIEIVTNSTRVISFSIDGLDAFRTRYAENLRAAGQESSIKLDYMWPSGPNRDDEMAISSGIYDESKKVLSAAIGQGYITTESAKQVLAGNFSSITTQEWVMLGALVGKKHSFHGFGIYFRAVDAETVKRIQDEIGSTLAVFGCNTEETSQAMIDMGINVVMTERRES